VAVVTIGGEPVDATLDGGSLWVSDFTGSLVEVDPAAARVTRRIGVPGQPEAIAAYAGSVWAVLTGANHCGGHVLRYGSGTGRLVERRAVPFPAEGVSAGGLVAGGDGVWVKSCAVRDGVDRLRPGSAREPRVLVDGVAVASGAAWAIDHDGTLLEIDAATARVRHRWRGLAPLGDPSFDWATHVLAPDRTGVWVLSTGRQAILRVEDGRVVRRIPVEAAARPLLAAAPDGLWVAVADRAGYRVIRYDPRTGGPDETVELGDRRPVALVASADRLCVVTGDGRILLVGS
jgi:hypothetical protein